MTDYINSITSSDENESTVVSTDINMDEQTIKEVEYSIKETISDNVIIKEREQEYLTNDIDLYEVKNIKVHRYQLYKRKRD